jgi:hypothetical protein
MFLLVPSIKEVSQQKKKKALRNAGTFNEISWLGLPLWSSRLHASSAFVRFATTAAEITMCTLTCSLSFNKLICIMA